MARELTKKFEEIRRGTVAELARYYEETPPRGEVVLVIGGASAPEPASQEDAGARARAQALRAAGTRPRDVAAALATEFGISRNAAYRLAHEDEPSRRSAVPET